MKSFLHIISIALFALTMHACAFNFVKGNGTITEYEVNISDYGEIDFSGDSEFIYEQKAGAPYLRIEVDENIYPLLDIKNNGNVLSIGSKENIHPTKYKIYTNSSGLTRFSNNGLAKVRIMGKLETPDLNISTSGSGNITIDNLFCNTLSTNASGSGNVTATGKVAGIDCRISGSGKVMTTELIADSVKCSVSGSGSFSVCAEKYLNINISGSGSVKYKGNPVIDQSISGSGKISRID